MKSASALSKLDTADIAREIEEVKATLALLVERVTNADGEGPVSRVKSAVNGSVSDLKHAAQEQLEYGQALAQNAQAAVLDSADRAAATVKENPLLSLAIAAGIGMLVGSLTRNR